jgi:hypothetical protein
LPGAFQVTGRVAANYPESPVLGASAHPIPSQSWLFCFHTFPVDSGETGSKGNPLQDGTLSHRQRTGLRLDRQTEGNRAPFRSCQHDYRVALE